MNEIDLYMNARAIHSLRIRATFDKALRLFAFTVLQQTEFARAENVAEFITDESTAVGCFISDSEIESQNEHKQLIALYAPTSRARLCFKNLYYLDNHRVHEIVHMDM